MPPTKAALVVVMSGSPDHGEITLKPMPAPKASRSRVNAAATKPPATMAGQETAGTAGVSASTMTVSTIAAPRVCPTTSSCARGSERKAAHHRPAYGIVPHGIVPAGRRGLRHPRRLRPLAARNTGETREVPDACRRGRLRPCVRLRVLHPADRRGEAGAGATHRLQHRARAHDDHNVGFAELAPSPRTRYAQPPQ